MTSRWRVAAAGGVVAVVAILVGAAVPLAPLFRADMALDDLVRAVALDWRDFGQQRAEERLQLEMSQQGLERFVSVDDCVFEPTEAGRVVRCAWGTSLLVPVVRRRIPLRFASRALIAPDGDLR